MASKSPISFTVKRSPRSRQYRCVVRNEGNHEPTFVGEPCKNRVDVLSMIDEHVAAIKEGRFAIIDENPPKPKPAKKNAASQSTGKATS